MGVRLPVEVIRLGDPAWESWLDLSERDIYHSTGYHHYAVGSGEGEANLVVIGTRERGLAWPYLLRHVTLGVGIQDTGACDVTSVYGYPGPVGWGVTPGDAFLDEAWQEILGVWREQRVVTAFTRFHPLLENAALARTFVAPDRRDGDPVPVATSGLTVSIDLREPDDAVRSAFARDLRRQIDVSRRQGLATEHDTGWTELGTFSRLYRENMERLGAADYYFFDEYDFERLRDALGEHLHLLVTRIDGQVAAAGLFMEWQGIAEWYLVGTEDAHRASSPSKVLVDDAVRWARDRGNTVLHMGGGRGGREDSLFWFKSRFSPRRHEFHIGRWIVDRPAYDALLAAMRSALPEGIVPQPGYFPAYRAPVMGLGAPTVGEIEAAVENGAAAVQEPTPPALRIKPVGPEDAEALGDLLADIDTTYFQPHPMTAEEAHRIAAYPGPDIFLIGYAADEAVAYGMLRGWQNGYETPSLGIGIRRSWQRRGYGRAMMATLHAAARGAGAHAVRLRVDPANSRAYALYRSMGYREAGVERGETLMLLDL